MDSRNERMSYDFIIDVKNWRIWSFFYSYSMRHGERVSVCICWTCSNIHENRAHQMQFQISPLKVQNTHSFFTGFNLCASMNESLLNVENWKEWKNEGKWIFTSFCMTGRSTVLCYTMTMFLFFINCRMWVIKVVFL